MFDVVIGANDRVDLVDDRLQPKMCTDELGKQADRSRFAPSFEQIEPEQFCVRRLDLFDRRDLFVVDGIEVRRLRAGSEEENDEPDFDGDRIEGDEVDEAVGQLLVHRVQVDVVPAADRLDFGETKLRVSGCFEKCVVDGQEKTNVLFDQSHLIVDGQLFEFGQVFEVADEVDDHRLLAIVELVETEGEDLLGRKVLRDARQAGVLIVAVRDVIDTHAVHGTEDGDGVRRVRLSLDGHLNGTHQASSSASARSADLQRSAGSFSLSILLELNTFDVLFFFGSNPFFSHA